MNDTLTQAELKILYLIMMVASSDYAAEFDERKIDRFALINKLGQMAGER
jgi:hypothetical protein